MSTGRRDVRRRLLAAALALGAVGACTYALRPGGATVAAASREAPLATPLWSARRVPQPVADAAGAQRLQVMLHDATAGSEACFDVRDLDAGVPRAGAATASPLIPASTQKLFTAAAALDVLGPEFRYETPVVATGKPAGGMVDRVWLVGAGDPVITTAAGAAALDRDPVTRGEPRTLLSALADRIAAGGVRSIPGGIVADDHRYSTPRYLPVWPDHYRTDGEIGPLGALTVDDGFSAPGTNAAAADPASLAADRLRELLVARGVSVGPSSRGTAPATATTRIATLESPRLGDIVTGLLTSSDNQTAEMLALELAVRDGRPGTTAEGTAAITRRLTALGLPTEGLHLVDGSGLARDNRATCALLMATLGLPDRSPRFAVLRSGLAVAGERGTLATRLTSSPLTGHLVAKTGSLNGVSALAGVVDTSRPLRFALLLNGGFGEADGIARRERIASLIAGFPDLPLGSALVPPPDPPAGTAPR